MALPPNPHPFTIASARLECDLLDGDVTHALERQVNRHVAEFAMLIGAMTEPKEGLQDAMESAICHVVSPGIASSSDIRIDGPQT